MMNLRGISRLIGFARLDGKGMGEWLLLAIILQIMTGRLASQVSENEVTIFGGAIPFAVFMICFVLYFNVFNLYVNQPQFGRKISMNAKQEVIQSLIGSFMAVGIMVLYMLFVALVTIIASGWHQIQIDFTNWKGVSISLEFYLIIFGSLFPIAFLRKKRHRYMGFLFSIMVTVIIGLLLLNWSNDFSDFRTIGMVWQDLNNSKNGTSIFIVLGVIAILFVTGGVKAAFLIHRPRRY